MTNILARAQNGEPVFYIMLPLLVVLALVAAKVVEIVQAEHKKAYKLLADNKRKLDEIAQYLYEKETISGEEFMRILNAQPQLPAGPSADSTNQAQ